MIRILTLSAITIFLSSCFTVEFKNPQPAGVESLTEFPEKIRGTYIMPDDGDTLIIGIRTFTYLDEVYDKAIPVLKAAADTNLIFRGDVLYNKKVGLNTPIPFKVTNDTLRYYYKDYKQHLISDSLVIKEYKNHVIFNIKENGRWTVMPTIIVQENGDLSMKLIHMWSYEEDEPPLRPDLMTLIASICEVDTISEYTFLLDPTKAEFRKMLRKDVFTPLFELKRIDSSPIKIQR